MATRTYHRQTDSLPAASPRMMRRLNRTDRAKVEALLAQPANGFMDDPSFHEPDAVRRLFDEAAALPTPNCDWYHPGVDAELDLRQPPAGVNTLLTAAQEKTIFLQFNYARFRAAALHRRLSADGFEERAAAELLFWDGEATRLRDRIVEFNLALVLAMARHVAAAKLDFADLLSEGNMALLRAVDKFDVSRAFKFSTYACRSILKAFSRMSVKRSRMRGLFPASFDPEFEQPATDKPVSGQWNEYTSELRKALTSNEAALTQLERQVIECRFPMEDDRSTDRPTLIEVGRMIGYSKERIRQIQKQALDKLRLHLASKFVEPPFEMTAGAT